MLWLGFGEKVAVVYHRNIGLWLITAVADDHALAEGAITSKIKHAIKHETSLARLAQLLQLSLTFCFRQRLWLRLGVNVDDQLFNVIITEALSNSYTLLHRPYTIYGSCRECWDVLRGIMGTTSVDILSSLLFSGAVGGDVRPSNGSKRQKT